MVDHSAHYGLLILDDGDLSPEGYRFVGPDRVLIDRLLWLGAEGHRHTGSPSELDAPTVSPNLVLDVTAGTLPPSTRVYYRHTYVDANDIETTPSDEVWIDTPAQVSAPAAATLAFATTGGVLEPGTYMYVLTAYKDFNDLETTVSPGASIQLPYAGATSTNEITLTMPALPSGADGFNIYRKGPGNVGYRYLASTSAATFDDDGTLTEDQDRPTPTVNTTVSNNSIEIELAEALPATYRWRLYRTLVADEWTSSLLATIGPTTDTYTDTGAGTSVGSPPEVGASPGSPEKVDLTDGLEVQGLLPAAMVEGLPVVLAFIDTAGDPGGYPVLDDDARLSLVNLPGPVLAASVRPYL